MRVNGLDTPWGVDDLRAVAESAADVCLIPKAESADDVLRAQDKLGSFVWRLACHRHSVGRIDSAERMGQVDGRLGLRFRPFS